MPDSVWKKLNLRDPDKVFVLNPPDSFEPEIALLERITVQRSLVRAKKVEFVLAFVTKQSEIAKLTRQISKKSEGDAIVWFAYPKKSSKNYSCDFNRDHGWEPLGEAGFEGVRQIAIDDDWSALRFRRAEFIKTMKRDPKRPHSRQFVRNQANE